MHQGTGRPVANFVQEEEVLLAVGMRTACGQIEYKIAMIGLIIVSDAIYFCRAGTAEVLKLHYSVYG